MDERDEHGSGGDGSRLDAVFVALSTDGPDPAFDELLALAAQRIGEPAACVEFEAGAPDSARRAAFESVHELGELEPLIALDARAFERWSAHALGRTEPTPGLVGLDELRALVFPARATRRVEPTDRLRAAADPSELASLLDELRGDWEAIDPDAREVLTGALAEAARRAGSSDPLACERIVLALRVLGAEPDTDASAAGFALEVGMGDLQPCWTRPGPTEAGPPSLPPDREGPLPFELEDSARLDAVFEEALPRLLAPDDPERAYRASQHAVAREVAATFGAPEPELLLVHAPTGTGKTLAYLVPALMWAKRHEVRLGIATYTRALQEQAMEREVPRALAALAGAGVDTSGLRVTVLKGRENYLCWRALERVRPEDDASWEEWLAFAQLLAFALTDATGDLDRLQQRPPVRLHESGRYLGVLRELVRQVRARSGCCKHRDDRRTCAGLVARWRAERSHVVLTNHSFALARQEFFRHMVFDECEHLHDQAHAAWSHAISLREVREWIARIGSGRVASGAGRRRGGLLGRVAKKLVEGSPTLDACRAGREALDELDGALARLAVEVEAFVRWREGARRERDAREEHALLREYAESDAGRDLLEALGVVLKAGAELDAGLSELAERLGAQPGRGFAQSVRQLDLARADLAETLEAFGAWIPMQEGRARFTPMTFHDVEADLRGGVVLTARVLLPNEVLGRFYHPRLASGVFLSATTWLRSGFEAAEGYLGLDRAAAPDEDEERPPSRVRTFRAPEVFDYSRVLVCVPRDVPPVAREKERFLAYVGEFLGRLGETTRGRVLGLFTNSEDLKRIGARLEGRFRARGVPLLYQGMRGTTKEELGDRFRATDSVLLGVDTFWYGADFPGECLEYLVIVKLPYGVPDRYHNAQCAALGSSDQRRRIYLPRALAKFRQGFGRLMRTVSDKGCVFVLDPRLLEPRHRPFVRELPLREVAARDELATPELDGARLVRGDTEHCLRAAFEHMGLATPTEEPASPPTPSREIEPRETPEFIDVSPEDLPF